MKGGLKELLTFQLNVDRVTLVTTDASTYHSLNRKCTQAPISWYINTSDIGVGDASGTVATV